PGGGMKVMALIPALNAEGTLPSVLLGVLEQLQDVVVVDDGSTDRTGDVARAHGVTVLRHAVNRGKGGALKTGFAHALEKGFDMESEVIVRAGRKGFRVITIPIDLGFVDGLSTSHYKPLKDTLRIAWTVTRARLFW